MSTLYIVATPIGNLEDISLRALRVLSEVKLIAAEDTRRTMLLLSKYKIKNRLTSYYEHNKKIKLDYILSFLIKDEGDVALVSEAGMPGISDPGYELIKSAIDSGIPVTVIPGATAIVSAAAVSGLPVNQFHYIGFIPRKKQERIKFFREIAMESVTLIGFEAPHRLKQSLKDMLEIFGNRKVAICRELTKVHEEIFRGDLLGAIEHFLNPKGEFTLIIEGNKNKTEYDINKINSDIARLIASGMRAREAIRELSLNTGISRKIIYNMWLSRKRSS